MTTYNLSNNVCTVTTNGKVERTITYKITPGEPMNVIIKMPARFYGDDFILFGINDDGKLVWMSVTMHHHHVSYKSHVEHNDLPYKVKIDSWFNDPTKNIPEVYFKINEEMDECYTAEPDHGATISNLLRSLQDSPKEEYIRRGFYFLKNVQVDRIEEQKKLRYLVACPRHVHPYDYLM